MTGVGYHFKIDVSDTPESLQALYDNPDTRWYAKKRAHALGLESMLPAEWSGA